MLWVRTFLSHRSAGFSLHKLPTVSTIHLQSEYQITVFLCQLGNVTQSHIDGTFFHKYVTGIGEMNLVYELLLQSQKTSAFPQIKIISLQTI